MGLEIGAASSMDTTRSRRPSNTFWLPAMKSCGPSSASTAAHCAMEQAPDVCWPWIMSMALMSFSGPAA